MTLVMPEGVPTLGTTKLKAILTIADATAPKLATEVNAASSKEVSLHFSPGGWGPTATQAKGTKPPRLGSKKLREQFNRTTYTIPTLQYIVDPQAVGTALVNDAFTILTEGTKIHLLERMGPDAESVPFAVADKTRDHYVLLGVQVVVGDRSDENAEYMISQECIYLTEAGPVNGVMAA